MTALKGSSRTLNMLTSAFKSSSKHSKTAIVCVSEDASLELAREFERMFINSTTINSTTVTTGSNTVTFLPFDDSSIDWNAMSASGYDATLFDHAAIEAKLPLTLAEYVRYNDVAVTV